MGWEAEFTATDGRGRRVEYQTLHMNGWSAAERKDRVTVSGKTVHKGWVSDQRGYHTYLQQIGSE